MDFTNDSSLVTASFPALTTNIVSAGFFGCTSLVTFNFLAATWQDGVFAIFINCALNQASVDFILHAGITGAIGSDTIDTSGGTSATPSAAGLVDAGILIGNGVNVSTN